MCSTWAGQAASSSGKATGVNAPILSVVQLDANGHLTRVRRSAQAGEVAKKMASHISGVELDRIIRETSEQYSVDPDLVRSLISVESNGNQLAVSVKGAQGLMQLIPATAQRFGVADPFDPQQNIEGGVRYLQYLRKRFPDDLTLSIAAFNAGENAVSRYGSVPPYRETVGYVKNVTRHYQGRVPVSTAAAEVFRHVEQTVDSQGRVYLRTR